MLLFREKVPSDWLPKVLANLQCKIAFAFQQRRLITAMNRNGKGVFRTRLLAALAILALIGAFLWSLSGHRQRALDQWVAEMRAKGEKFTLTELGLDRPARTNAAMEVIETAASRLNALDRARVSVQFQMTEGIGSARKRVTWAETNLHSVTTRVFDWDALSEEVRQLRPVLTSISNIMRDPPLDSGRDYVAMSPAVNLVAIRTVAQSLYDITMYDLHVGDISAAQQDLLALIGMANLHAEGWTLVDQMIRVAVEGLAADAIWNALQTPGWTDDQLAELQQRLADLSFFKELEQTFRVERAVGFYYFCNLRTNGYSAIPGFLNPRQSIPISDLPEAALESGWKSLWADSDFLFYCQFHQELIESLHRLAATRSYREVASDIAGTYRRLDRVLTGIGKYRYLWSQMAIANSRRAMETVVKNETSRELAIAAIAIERSRLRHGKLPAVTDLQPEVVRDMPVDFYVGKPLRYRPDGDGVRLTLYSVGPDFRDDGGNTNDLVWPTPVWPVHVAK